MVRNSVDRLTGEDGALCYFARIFFICIKVDPPDDQNQDFFPGLIAPKNTIHVQSMAKALKIAWAKRLLGRNLSHGRRQLTDHELERLSNIIFKCNQKYNDIRYLKLNLNSFWQVVLECWCNYT